VGKVFIFALLSFDESFWVKNRAFGGTIVVLAEFLQNKQNE